MDRHSEDDRKLLCTEMGPRISDSLKNSREKQEQACKLLEEMLNKADLKDVRPSFDPRDTDNAWVEPIIFYAHDASGRGMGKYEFENSDGGRGLAWRVLHAQVNVPYGYLVVLNSIAESLNAYW